MNDAIVGVTTEDHAKASEIMHSWIFIAEAYKDFCTHRYIGNTVEEAVEKLRESMTKKKFKGAKYHIYLVHPETRIDGLYNHYPKQCYPIKIGDFIGT